MSFLNSSTIEYVAKRAYKLLKSRFESEDEELYEHIEVCANEVANNRNYANIMGFVNETIRVYKRDHKSGMFT